MILKILLIIGIGLVGGLLGAFGGASNLGGYSKLLRRIGIASLLTLVALIAHKFHVWQDIFIMGLAGILGIGYGVPDATDKGSALGRFYYKLLNGSHFWSNFCTRLTVAIALCVPALFIAWANASWSLYIRVVGGLVANYMVWTAFVPKEGSIKLFGVVIAVEEFLVYFGLSVGYLILILL